MSTWSEQLQSLGGTSSSTASDLESLYKKAEAIILDQQIGSRERLIHLRAHADGMDTRCTATELQQILWRVRRQLLGAAEPIGQGGKLVIEEAPWLWQDVLLKGCTNLLVALPKTGKSRLITMALGRMVRGDGEFLGRPLQQSSPPVLIVGSDQNQRDWAKCLSLAGLLASDGTMHNAIVGLFHKGCPLHLDEEGIDLVAAYCEKYPELLILVDTYHSCTSHLGLDEASASFADPLIDLQEAISPFGATLVVIHHSNKNAAGGRASQASRGSTALPGAVSQTITMHWADGADGAMGTRRDKRVKLTTEGREGEPVDLLIEQVDEGRDWVLHGTGEEIAMQGRLELTIEKLTERQYEALQVLCQHWQATQQGMDAVHLAQALNLSGATPHSKARTVLLALHQRGLVIDAGCRDAIGSAGGQPARLYRPIDEVLALSPESPVLPIEPLIESVPPPATESKRGKTGRTAISSEGPPQTCPQCGKTFRPSRRGRKPTYCSTTCRVKAHKHRQPDQQAAEAA